MTLERRTSSTDKRWTSVEHTQLHFIIIIIIISITEIIVNTTILAEVTTSFIVIKYHWPHFKLFVSIVGAADSGPGSSNFLDVVGINIIT